jgi:hypothetical protein
LGELFELEPEKVRQKEKKASAGGGELPGIQGEVGEVGDRLDGRPRPSGSFLVEASWQGGKPFLLEYLADGGRAEASALFTEDLADLIDGVVLFAQCHDSGVGGGLLRRPLGPWMGREEELGIGLASELMTEDAEGAGGVAELVSHLRRGSALEEVGSEGLVHALLGQKRFGEKAAALC